VSKEERAARIEKITKQGNKKKMMQSQYSIGKTFAYLEFFSQGELQ